MHTGLVSGWAGVMTLYELIVIDPTDPCIILYGDRAVTSYLSYHDWELLSQYMIGHLV